MKNYQSLVDEALTRVPEVMPWDLRERLQGPDRPVLLDIREPEEYAAMHIPDSLHVPRGILEAAAEWGFDETEPRLAGARDEEVVVICRSGRRSALAARTLQELGFTRVQSLKLGVRGWNDDDGPLEDARGEPVDPDEADEYLRVKVRPDQMGPDS
ncbi:rhodanese-like domain-containing protein [Thioalkalivibrio thiocyanodenitrificans]|uniref:rhodanese-like domain-containing protein n=1 Tax=Thioalkalivibrio thiocyanodenitrificans TaxID=243063 RepID=UPI000361EE90|nr:rhodanese-like domain-containing protein [Thioalkalivibrio thiocyanodenitrificans]